MIGWGGLKDRAEFEAIVGLVSDSARAAAIVAATIVEDRLEQKLQKSLRKSTVYRSLFGANRPLHFFVARNQLAYLMKIYGKPFYQELETIGSIRNKFAHYYSDNGKPIRDFKSSEIKNLCDKLKFIEPFLKEEEEREKERKALLSAGRTPSWARQPEYKTILADPRQKYLRTCALCASALSGHLDAKLTERLWSDTFP